MIKHRKYLVHGEFSFPVYANDEDEAFDIASEWIQEIYDSHKIADSMEITGMEQDYENDGLLS